MSLPISDAERQEHIDSVIKVFQKLILNAKKPSDKLKFTLSLELYQVTESIIWDLNFTDKYGQNIQRSQLFEVLIECFADAFLPFMTDQTLPEQYHLLTKVLGKMFTDRLNRGIKNNEAIQSKLTEKDMIKIMETFVNDTNRTSKPSP